MTTVHQHGQAFAATVPIAMTGLAEHIATHHLDTPAQIIFIAPLVGDTDAQAIQILLDARHVDDWLASLDTQTPADISQHTDGMWHDVYGVANSVRVRLSWYTVTRSFGAAPVRLSVVTDHEPCHAPDCDEFLCYCRTVDRCPGAVEPGCSHLAEFVCADHRDLCAECRSESHAGISSW